MKKNKNLYIIVLAFTINLLFNIILQFDFIKVLLIKDILFKEAIKNIYELDILTRYLYILVFMPIIEEFMFRKILYNLSKKYYSLKVSVLISSLTFAIYHFNFIQGIYAFIIGILLAYFYEYNKSIIYTIFFHISLNTFSLLFTNSFIFSKLIVYNKFIVAFCILIIIFISEKINFKELSYEDT